MNRRHARPRVDLEWRGETVHAQPSAVAEADTPQGSCVARVRFARVPKRARQEHERERMRRVSGLSAKTCERRRAPSAGAAIELVRDRRLGLGRGARSPRNNPTRFFRQPRPPNRPKRVLERGPVRTTSDPDDWEHRAHQRDCAHVVSARTCASEKAFARALRVRIRLYAWAPSRTAARGSRPPRRTSVRKRCSGLGERPPRRFESAR